MTANSISSESLHGYRKHEELVDLRTVHIGRVLLSSHSKYDDEANGQYETTTKMIYKID